MGMGMRWKKEGLMVSSSGGAAAAGALELIAVEARYWDETVCMSCLLVLHTVYEQRAPACLHRLHY